MSNCVNTTARRCALVAAALAATAFSLAAQALPVLPPDPADKPPPTRPGRLTAAALDEMLGSTSQAQTQIELIEVEAASVPEPSILLLLAMGAAAWRIGHRCQHRADQQMAVPNRWESSRLNRAAHSGRRSAD